MHLVISHLISQHDPHTRYHTQVMHHLLPVSNKLEVCCHAQEIFHKNKDRWYAPDFIINILLWSLLQSRTTCKVLFSWNGSSVNFVELSKCRLLGSCCAMGSDFSLIRPCRVPPIFLLSPLKIFSPSLGFHYLSRCICLPTIFHFFYSSFLVLFWSIYLYISPSQFHSLSVPAFP